MSFKDSLITAISGLQANRSRSALTILGIVIGISAIILIMAVGQGAQYLVLQEIQGIGSKTVAVIPGRHPSGLSDFAQIFTDSLTERDLKALQRKENVPTLKEIMPVVFGGESSAYGRETYRLTIFGASPLISEIFDLQTDKGEFFSEDDVSNRSNVIIIGDKVREELFGLNEAVGERIRIRDQSFRIIGTLPKKGQVSFFNFDEMAIVPYSTAQNYIFGIKYFHRFIVEAESEDLIPQTVSDVKATLRESHNITDPEKDDFFVETQADLVARLNIITSILTILLASIAAISLVVGGIGIMNIMLVSVSERTREIGLRKAIGATNKDIMVQFLFEALILTTIGGIIGIILGAVFSLIIALALSKVLSVEWNFIFPVSAAFLGLGVAAMVGLLFGIYPARQAASKDPIESLRYE